MTWSVIELGWVDGQGSDNIQGWGTAELWQTSPNWHLTFFAIGAEVGQLSSPLWVLVGKVPYANMANGSIVEPLILTAHATMKLCTYSRLVGVRASCTMAAGAASV